MYLYLYDSFLNDKKYNRLLAKIETRLTDLGIGGKIFRLSPLRNIDELLTDEVKNGVKTIIIVGNDKTFGQIIDSAAKLDVPLGLIPIGSENKIAQLLGIPREEEACNTVAARIVKRIDLGMANNTYFLSSLVISGEKLTIECESKYKVTPKIKNQVSICNLKPLFALDIGPKYFNPQDGFLEILIQPITTGFFQFFRKANNLKNSIIPFKKISIHSKDSIPVTTDGKKILKTPVRIEIVPKKLKIIVGKKRMF
jgi:diacylglycerol kinase family enzyme